MTEQEWLACTGPMLEFLRGKASDRKLRLFACACCRRFWNCLWSGRVGQEAILTAERFADGLATVEELGASRWLVLGQLELHPGEPVFDPSYWACGRDIQEGAEKSAGYAANRSTISVDESADDFDARCEERRVEESNVQASFLHDLFGPMLFNTMTFDPSWRTWHDSTVPKIAQTIYDDRHFQDLPILADALEKAGCSSADILNHCRSEGPHVRGCWVVDLILGKW
jgi:hypothetical protein